MKLIHNIKIRSSAASYMLHVKRPTAALVHHHHQLCVTPLLLGIGGSFPSAAEQWLH